MNSFLNNLINRKNIHLDYASTTPVDPIVFRVMKPYLQDRFFNPSSSYRDAQDIKKEIRARRSSIARFFHCRENEVIFTQGGTESANLAILGLAQWTLRECDFVPHMLFSSIEHPAVSECIAHLEYMGIEVEIIPVSKKGIVDVQELEKKIRDQTVLVSIIAVSNETGVLQPLHKISSIIKKFKNRTKRTFGQFPYLHTDASQAVVTHGALLPKVGADMITIDGSKIYAPKMTGLLIKKQYVTLVPLMYGGGQESGLRPGTENPAHCAALDTALMLVQKYSERDTQKFAQLKQLCLRALESEGIQFEINGTVEDAVPTILNVCIAGLDADFAVIQMDELGVNCASMTACASNKDILVSRVLQAMGRAECARSSLRFSFGRTTRSRDISRAIKILAQVCRRQKLV